jgi:hypothetical protein
MGARFIHYLGWNALRCAQATRYFPWSGPRIGTTTERPTQAAKNQKEFVHALLQSAPGKLLLDKDLSWKSGYGLKIRHVTHNR